MLRMTRWFKLCLLRMTRSKHSQPFDFFCRKFVVARPDGFYRVVTLCVTNVQTRIIDKERPCADEDRIAHGTKFVVPAVGALPCDFHGLMGAIGQNVPHGAFVGNGALDFYKGSLVADEVIVSFEVAFNIVEDYAAFGDGGF